LTSYLFVNQDPEYFAHKNSGHFFYTPRVEGLSNVTTKVNPSTSESKEDIKEWLRQYFMYNTFEISIPAVRDKTLSPTGKTALIVSILLDYDIVKHIADMGWYDEFKKYVETLFAEVLDHSIYPGLQSRVFDSFSSSPLTIEKRTGNTDGAITGWAFTNSFMPAVNSLPKIASSVKTVIPNVSHAGQWSYSPAGLPISILTGKLAADRAKKQLKK
jgi:phytoene dehydrogenase-like protein